MDTSKMGAIPRERPSEGVFQRGHERPRGTCTACKQPILDNEGRVVSFVRGDDGSWVESRKHFFCPEPWADSQWVVVRP